MKSKTSLFVAIAVVAVVLIFFPAYRWFFVVSLVIGLVVGGFCISATSTYR